MKPTQAATYLLYDHWDGNLPVDPIAIARTLGVKVEEDTEMGEEYGLFEFVDGSPYICVNANTHAIRKRFMVAHELGHYVLKHGDRFVDTAREMRPVQLDYVEMHANNFALELLIPGFAVEILIMKRNVGRLEELADLFWVGETAMHAKLKKLGWNK